MCCPSQLNESGDAEFGIGVVGCGAFGQFALQQFTQVEGVDVKAVVDTNRETALRCSQRFGRSCVVADVDELLDDPGIHIVYIATPPYLHHAQAMAALKACKHVICEKPLALNLEQADEMIATARDKGLVVIADLMQRYNCLRVLSWIPSKTSQALTARWRVDTRSLRRLSCST